MSYFYLHFSKVPGTPWAVLETNENRTVMLNSNLATELEINVPCKTFIGKYHYFHCEGEIEWQGTKAIINPVK